MNLFPVFLKLSGKRALVVGGGMLAQVKIEQLVAAGAFVRVVAPKANPRVNRLGLRKVIQRLQREFVSDDVAGMSIVFAATGRREIDRHVFRACQDGGIFCNAVDDPEYCDFYMPAIVRRGDLQIAISTNGKSPALAQQIRQQLELQFGPEWSQRVAKLGRQRQEAIATIPAGPQRLSRLHEQAREALSEVTAVSTVGVS